MRHPFRFPGTLGLIAREGEPTAPPPAINPVAVAAPVVSGVGYEGRVLRRWHGSYDLPVVTPSWSEVGTPLALPDQSDIVITALATDTIVATSVTSLTIQAYRRQGGTWAALGNALPVAALTRPAIRALTATDIVVSDGASDTLQVYRFDGTDWAPLGSALSIPGLLRAAVTSLNDRDVVVADRSTQTIQVYRFDGMDWAPLGNPLALSHTFQFRPALVGLGATRIAYTSDAGVPDTLRVYEFDGSDWSAVGNPLTLPDVAAPSIVALSASDVVVADFNADLFQAYRFNGTDWSALGSNFPIDNHVRFGLALTDCEVAFVDGPSPATSLRTIRFDPGYKVSGQWHADGQPIPGETDIFLAVPADGASYEWRETATAAGTSVQQPSNAIHHFVPSDLGAKLAREMEGPFDFQGLPVDFPDTSVREVVAAVSEIAGDNNPTVAPILGLRTADATYTFLRSGATNDYSISLDGGSQDSGGAAVNGSAYIPGTNIVLPGFVPFPTQPEEVIVSWHLDQARVHNRLGGFVTNSGGVFTARGSASLVFLLGQRLTDEERRKLEGYVAWKLGIQARLVAGHAHRLVPPDR